MLFFNREILRYNSVTTYSDFNCKKARHLKLGPVAACWICLGVSFGRRVDRYSTGLYNACMRACPSYHACVGTLFRQTATLKFDILKEQGAQKPALKPEPFLLLDSSLASLRPATQP